MSGGKIGVVDVGGGFRGNLISGAPTRQACRVGRRRKALDR